MTRPEATDTAETRARAIGQIQESATKISQYLEKADKPDFPLKQVGSPVRNGERGALGLQTTTQEIWPVASESGGDAVSDTFNTIALDKHGKLWTVDGNGQAGERKGTRNARPWNGDQQLSELERLGGTLKRVCATMDFLYLPGLSQVDNGIPAEKRAELNAKFREANQRLIEGGREAKEAIARADKALEKPKRASGRSR